MPKGKPIWNDMGGYWHFPCDCVQYQDGYEYCGECKREMNKQQADGWRDEEADVTPVDPRDCPERRMVTRKTVTKPACGCKYPGHESRSFCGVHRCICACHVTPVLGQQEPPTVQEFTQALSNLPIRKFETGATRDTNAEKHDYHRFESALVTKRFGEYMYKNRKQLDGSLREPDNWKKGIPKEVYMDSLDRHVQDAKLYFEGFEGEMRADLEETLCAIIFNARGMLFEVLKEKAKKSPQLTLPLE